MLKLAGCIIILISSAGIGVLLCREYSQRLIVLKEIKLITFLLHGDIRYSYTPLTEALHSVQKRYSGVLSSFLECLICRLKPDSGERFNVIWASCVEESIAEKLIDKRDSVLLYDLGDSLDIPDISTKLSSLEGLMSRINQQIDEYSATLADKLKLIRTLSILSGVFVIILLL